MATSPAGSRYEWANEWVGGWMRLVVAVEQRNRGKVGVPCQEPARSEMIASATSAASFSTQNVNLRSPLLQADREAAAADEDFLSHVR